MQSSNKKKYVYFKKLCFQFGKCTAMKTEVFPFRE